jgi:cytochrome c556
MRMSRGRDARSGKAAWLVMLCAALVCVACAEKAPPAPPPIPFKSVATVKQLMNAMTVPTSNVVFGAAGETPKDDAGWVDVERNALALVETGNLLLLPDRAKDDKEWRQQSIALMEAATLAVNAAEAKNPDKLSEASDAIYAVCESCHQHFKSAAATTLSSAATAKPAP